MYGFHTARMAIRAWASAAALVLLAVVAGPASATIAPTGMKSWSSNYAGFSGGSNWPTAVQACQNAVHPGTTYTSTVLFSGDGVGDGSVWTCNYAGGTIRVTQTSTFLSCSAYSNSTLSGGNCVCNTNYSELNGSCQATWMKTLADLNSTGASLQYTGTTYQLSVCHNGIQVTGSGTALGIKGGVGMGEVYGPFTSTGASCGGAPAGAPAPVPCKAGEFAGQVNGVDVCVKASGVKDAPTTTTAPASGASGAATSGIPNAPAGAVTSVESTTCTGAKCTTTTDYKDGGGTIVGTRTEDKTQASFCADNPASSICLPAKSECELNPDTIGCSKYGTAVAQTLPGSSVSVSMGSVSFGGSASCPSDLPMSFSVMGHGFTPAIKWTSLCGTLNDYVKPVMLVLAVAAAGFIFVGGLKSGG